MRFEGLIFDFNGVLWWDGPLQEQSWTAFSAEIRGVPLSAEEMALHVHGRNNRHTLEYLIGRAIEENEVEQLSEQKERVYRRLCLAQGPDFRLSPGAVQFLDDLVSHDTRHTIATASGRANVDFFVDHLHLERWFDVERIVYDNGSGPGKPAPDIYLQAARNLGLDPAQCVVVEDSRSGIQAAHRAGMGYIIALGPAGIHAQLAQWEGVDEVIENLGQFPTALLWPQER
jgi:HAD superfamily hydrolase (TIGR01509 family)